MKMEHLVLMGSLQENEMKLLPAIRSLKFLDIEGNPIPEDTLALICRLPLLEEFIFTVRTSQAQRVHEWLDKRQHFSPSIKRLTICRVFGEDDDNSVRSGDSFFGDFKIRKGRICQVTSSEGS
eukprot:TRINITY_DN6753_c0_g2_i6.p2 TRINITY_DN6753_c0_g2~~TRINITY_DN6753_c0_g2_i6.p2  ORF type:complete len:123 (-),score=21.02 TRINITY_DN6753_c0_g2_i6:117-485(-)